MLDKENIVMEYFEFQNREHTGDLHEMTNGAGTETKSGNLILSKDEKGKKGQKLVVKIYCKSLDPFAVFYQDKKYCKPCGFMKLKYCAIEKVYDDKSGRSFRVVPKNWDGGAMIFTADDEEERDEWVHYFEGNCPGQLPGSSVMPTLEESEEDDDDDDGDHDEDGEDIRELPSDRYKQRTRRKSLELRRNSLRSLGLRMNRYSKQVFVEP